MGPTRSTLHLRDIQYLRRALRHCFPAKILIGNHAFQHHDTPFNTRRVHVRGAKTVSKRKLKDLTQGVIQASPLPVQETDNIPQYPSVLQGVKNNIIKFNQCVVLTRIGNFYELYFEHAEQYGPLLGLNVVPRSTALGPVAMAGFPFWQLDRFLKILVQDLNKYVAISEEFPVAISEKVRSGGLQYERKVARVVTPGTLIDENFLDPYQNNFLLALEVDQAQTNQTNQDTVFDATSDSKIGLAWLDLSTGDFFTQTTSYSLLPATMMRIGPREILLSQSVPSIIRDDIARVLGHSRELVTVHEASSSFTKMTEWNPMLEIPLAETIEQNFPENEKLSAHRLLDYVRTRLQNSELRLRPPRRRDENDILNIDRGSLRGLEILETAKDGLGKGSLFHAVRRTVTKGGSRLLRDRLTTPSTSLHDINERLELVTRFLECESLRNDVRNFLSRTFDVKRLVQTFALNKGDADNMLCLARAIFETSNIFARLQSAVAEYDQENEDPLKSILEKFNMKGPVELSQSISDAIDEEGLNKKLQIEENENIEVAALVEEAVMKTAPEELPMFSRKSRPKFRTSSAKAHFEENEDPWIMRQNASEALSHLHTDLDAIKTERMQLQDRLRNSLSTPKLELKWTPGLGHICHITSSKALSASLIDTLQGRVISTSKSTRSLYLPEWSRLGERLARARLNIRDEESRIFRRLRQQIIDNLVFLRRNAGVNDELDVLTSFALLAHEQGWTRPKLNNSLSHRIVNGRHPTVKLGLEEQGRTFVSNDLFLGEQERVVLITGPNMGGKSTFLRQNALITILAQVGSYVPAEHAEIGLVDQIFSRIGAADDLFRDQSTFMVEMLETAAILKHATPRSFVILDEVGRGTTPEDGTALSFASLHHLYHTNRCRTLFATHFHALIDMSKGWPELGRYCTDVLEDSAGSFTFDHKLKPGVNRQSHALKVAKMAGLPDTALDIATNVQQSLKAQRHAQVELGSLDKLSQQSSIRSGSNG